MMTSETRFMRLWSGFAAVTLVAACHAAPTELFDRPTGPPPSGLAVTLGISPSTATPFPGPAITAAGDSVVVSAEDMVSGCLDYAATAGVSTGNTLVVTITETTTAAARVCAMDKSTALFRAVVRPAPRGTYLVILRERTEWLTDGPMERELARGSANLP
jgi:hypothetical protein